MRNHSVKNLNCTAYVSGIIYSMIIIRNLFNFKFMTSTSNNAEVVFFLKKIKVRLSKAPCTYLYIQGVL